MRYRRAPRLADGTIDPLALVALSDTMPPAIIQKLGPGTPMFFAPSVDLTAHVLESTREEWILLAAAAGTPATATPAPTTSCGAATGACSCTRRR